MSVGYFAADLVKYDPYRRCTVLKDTPTYLAITGSEQQAGCNLSWTLYRP